MSAREAKLFPTLLFNKIKARKKVNDNNDNVFDNQRSKHNVKSYKKRVKLFKKVKE